VAITSQEAALRLRLIAIRLESEEYDPAALQRVLAPVNAMLYEQLLPPCTCRQWQGPSWGQHWHCHRHHIGEGNVSMPPTLVLGPPPATEEGDPA
jgi:hypothetical protein